MSTAVQNRQTAIQFVNGMKDHDGADESLVTPDCKWVLPPQAIWKVDDIKKHVQSRRSGLMPDLPTMTVTTAEGDRVAV